MNTFTYKCLSDSGSKMFRGGEIFIFSKLRYFADILGQDWKKRRDFERIILLNPLLEFFINLLIVFRVKYFFFFFFNI